MEGQVSQEETEHLDVVVVGAGLSGVGAAYRLQTECPDRTYAILEARDAMGGTWDLFRYPGVRSDSDMFTLGYPFEPWQAEKSIADGPSILRYIQDTAAEFGIDAAHPLPHQGGRRRLVDSDDAAGRCTLETAATAPRTTDLRLPLLLLRLLRLRPAPTPPTSPGIETFAGEVVHPQFWPEDLDYAGKRVVVIGSGATAVTLVPAMAADCRARDDAAAHADLDQRGPGAGHARRQAARAAADAASRTG